MKIINAQPNQTLSDIALRYYGTCEAVGELLANNPEIKNDPTALVALGIDPLSDSGFYVDVALLPASRISLDTNSPLLRPNITREIIEPITTFDL